MSVLFDQLRVSDNGKKLYINVHVNKASDFDNVHLKSITIMTSDKVSETHPEVPTSNYIYKIDLTEGNYKEAHLVLTASDFQKIWETDPKARKFTTAEIPTTLFFVYVETKGVFGECTPCRLDETITLGVTFDTKLLYQKVMQFTKQLADTCKIPKAFLDFILLWNGFRAAVETEHFIPAIEFWKELFFKGRGVMVNGEISNSCGCHG